ncbi:LysR family transcriptional regulator [Saccharospirillum salsuginis]|nr:LysR family transcriptional regulator [Saccharospirillum salsuginis]
MDKLRALQYYVRVVEEGNFSRAARHFSVPPSSLSRRVADLEAHLGATLLKRSTRHVQPTEVGLLYYDNARDILERLAASDEAVSHYQSRPMGRLRVSATVGFGETILLPVLDRFTRQYPDITLDVRLSDELSVLDRDDIDLAIRGGYAPDERVIGIKLMDNTFVPVASPAYLDRAGYPRHPLDLRQHSGLYFQTPQGPTPWLCRIDGHWQDVSGPPAVISNAGRWLLDQAVAGKGILMMPRWALQPSLDTGELVQLDLTPTPVITRNPDIGIYLLYQKLRYRVPKVRAAVDFLTAHFDQPS